MKLKTLRYTEKKLRADIVGFNETLAARNDPYRFVWGSRYGHNAIDLATPEQVKSHTVQRNLEIGTPRECLKACYRYLAMRVPTSV